MGITITEAQAEAMRNSNDPPDFHFYYKSRCIALEHTCVFMSSKGGISPQHQKAIGNEICEIVRLGLTCRDPKIEASIGINFGALSRVKTPGDKKRVASAVIKLIAKFMEANPNWVDTTLCPYECRLPGNNLDEVQTVNIMHGPLNVHLSDFGFVYLGCHPAFDSAAKKKAKGLAKYRQHYHESWLLLSAGSCHHGEFIEPAPAACQQGITCDFDRVFFVDHDLEKYWEIAVTKHA